MSTVTTGAESVEWNLADLYDGPDDPRIETELEESHAAAKAFRERYRGELGELSAAELNAAVEELERIESSSTRVETYARVFFDPDLEPMVTCKTPGDDQDILASSANNMYEGVTMADLECF